MDAVLDLLSVLIFLTILLAAFTLRSVFKKDQPDKKTALRLAALKETLGAPQVSEFDKAAAGIVRSADQLAQANWPIVGPVLARLWIDMDVIGWRDSIRTRCLLLAMISMIVGVSLGKQTPAPVLGSVVLALVSFAALFSLLYKRALHKYMHELKQSLPEAIDSITRAARAGVPVSNAFIMVANNLTGPLAHEFRMIDNWMKLGVPMRQAMQDSAQRIPLNEYRFFAVILIINQEAGGRLGETLERLSATLRERQELQLKIQSKTSEARASAKIVASLVPVSLLYMYLNSPRDFHFLLNDPTGNSVLFYAFGSVSLGLIITQRMVRRIG